MQSEILYLLVIRYKHSIVGLDITNIL